MSGFGSIDRDVRKELELLEQGPTPAELEARRLRELEERDRKWQGQPESSIRQEMEAAVRRRFPGGVKP